MTIKNKLKTYSGQLQQFPYLWKTAVKIYGFRKFDPLNYSYKNIKHIPTSFQLSNINFDLIFDVQCLQSRTLQRGIGKYSLKLISAICNSYPERKYLAYLTNIAPESNLHKAQQELKELKCPNLDIVVFDICKNTKRINVTNAQLQLLRELGSLNCKRILTLSPFENYEYAVTLPNNGKFVKIAILYDLIKLKHSKDLLISNNQRSFYLWTLKNLSKFDLLLAISNETKNHWVESVESNSPIEVIYGGIDVAPIEKFRTLEDRSGILCIGSEQNHKNLKRLILSYKELNEDIKLRHSLTILGVHSPGAKRRLEKLAFNTGGKIVFKDYLSESQLADLYKKSRILVMPSIIEGLSLPILEAWGYGLVAIGSNNTVAEELIDDKELLFDPFNIFSIAEVMNKLLTQNGLWRNSQINTISRSSKFSWNLTAERMFLAINHLDSNHD